MVLPRESRAGRRMSLLVEMSSFGRLVVMVFGWLETGWGVPFGWVEIQESWRRSEVNDELRDKEGRVEVEIAEC